MGRDSARAVDPVKKSPAAAATALFVCGTPVRRSFNMENRREVYRSSNGDVWFLVRNPDGRFYVQHQPNQASGGKSSCLDVATFLATSPQGPQHQAIVSLIGSLVEGEQIPPADIPKR
jgi:hypothetical protein